jgi:hypothetical protein
VSSAVAFLLSEGAAYITGATLRVDGGSSLLKRKRTDVIARDFINIYVNVNEQTSFPACFKFTPIQYNDKL